MSFLGSNTSKCIKNLHNNQKPEEVQAFFEPTTFPLETQKMYSHRGNYGGQAYLPRKEVQQDALIHPNGFTFEEWFSMSPKTSSHTLEQNRTTFQWALTKAGLSKLEACPGSAKRWEAKARVPKVTIEKKGFSHRRKI